MENALLSNTAAAAGTSGSPTRTLGGVQTWISTNVDAGTGGSGAGGGAAKVAKSALLVFSIFSIFLRRCCSCFDENTVCYSLSVYI